MRVTIDLTDDQADRIGKLRPGCESESMLHDAIIAARPKPLKVGDKVVKRRTSFGFVIALGRATNYWVAIVEYATGGITLISPGEGNWEMSTGSPIVWPEP